MLTVAEKAMKLNDWKYSAGNTMNISDFCIAALNTKFVRMKARLPSIYWLWAEIQPWLFQQKVITLQIKP